MFVFVHIPPVFSVLLTYSLKVNSLLFDPPCISWIRLLKSLLQEPNSTPPAGCPSTRVRTSAPRLSLGFVHSTRTALKLTRNKSTQLHNAFIGHARQRHDLIGCSETNSQFTPPVTRHDKTVLSVLCQAVWIESRDRLEKSADHPRRVAFSLSYATVHRVFTFLRGVQRRCVWVVGRLGVAACLACVAAAAVDRQARQSCRLWCPGVNWTIAVNVFGLQIFSRRQSWQSSSQRRSGSDTDKTVLSCLAWRCELALRRSVLSQFMRCKHPIENWSSVQFCSCVVNEHLGFMVSLRL